MICNSKNIYPIELAKLKEFCTIQILFKIRGLYSKGIGRGVYLSNSAKSFITALGISPTNKMSLGILASLEFQECCIINSDNIVKRRFIG